MASRPGEGTTPRAAGPPAPSPALVGNHFIKQYYGEVPPKKPLELHRFYHEQSTFCHATGSTPEEPVTGLQAIKAKIQSLGLADAIVDLDCGSVDAQPSQSGVCLVLVPLSVPSRTCATDQTCSFGRLESRSDSLCQNRAIDDRMHAWCCRGRS